MNKSDNNRNKMASDNLSLAKEKVLVTMAHLFPAHYESYWDTRYNIIRKGNELTG